MTEDEEVWGMYTNIPWGDDGRTHRKDGKTFVFSFYSGQTFPCDPLIKLPCSNMGEVFHSKEDVFCLGGYNPTFEINNQIVTETRVNLGPCAIKSDTKRSSAILDKHFLTRSIDDNETIVAGSKNPKVQEVQIYHLIENQFLYD